MRNVQIGQQLRSYRINSGLSAEEVAGRLGVSRAALYRYEKGEVIKLDTIKRLGELLGITPLSLLGVGMEYYTDPSEFQSHLLSEESEADHLLIVDGPICSLITSNAYDATLGAIHSELADSHPQHALAISEQGRRLVDVLGARKRQYRARRPGIISLISSVEVQRVLHQGIGAGLPFSDALRSYCLQIAVDEIINIAEQIEAEPMGLQFGLLENTSLNGSFRIMRSRHQAMLVTNPFHSDCHPVLPSGISVGTRSEDAIRMHQNMAEQMWTGAMKGRVAAARLREMIAAAPRKFELAA